MITNTTASELLTEFKEYFITLLQHMSLDEIDEDWAEELLAQRYYSGFEDIWVELSDNCPEKSSDDSTQIQNAMKEIKQHIPKELHHELALCIYEDFDLLARYVVAGEDNRYIASMCLCYAEGYIPMLALEPTNKSLQDAYTEFKMKMKIGETLKKFIHNRADDKF